MFRTLLAVLHPSFADALEDGTLITLNDDDVRAILGQTVSAPSRHAAQVAVQNCALEQMDAILRALRAKTDLVAQGTGELSVFWRERQDSWAEASMLAATLEPSPLRVDVAAEVEDPRMFWGRTLRALIRESVDSAAGREGFLLPILWQNVVQLKTRIDERSPEVTLEGTALADVLGTWMFDTPLSTITLDILQRPVAPPAPAPTARRAPEDMETDDLLAAVHVDVARGGAGAGARSSPAPPGPRASGRASPTFLFMT